MRLGGAILAASALTWSAGHATEIETGGLVFSDERGGFELISATGSGTVDDPVVVVERLTGPGATLTIRSPRRREQKSEYGLSWGAFQLSLVKVVINATAKSWSGFSLELQEQPGKASVYEDGLSFDQMQTLAVRPIRSDVFDRARNDQEPQDRIRFNDGRVEAGGTVRFEVNITDMTPREVFYLVQEPDDLLTEQRSDPGRVRLAAIR